MTCPSFLNQLPGPVPVPDQPLSLLGGLTPEQFMRRYWQKKPFLVRQAVPGMQAPLSRSQLFALAGQEVVESRLVVRHAEQAWDLEQGPFQRADLPPLKQKDWTLLVQGVDLHDEGVHRLMQAFRFVPDARLDDVMISWAAEGGGVGPHFDSYDVFLLQAEGRRRWRIGRQRDLSLVPDLPVKILQQFEPEEEWVLEPGDMLYLPPGWAHDGVADGGSCMTCSIGFRVPQRGGLAAELAQRLAEAHEDDTRLYRDPTQRAGAAPAAIPEGLQAFAREAMQRLLQDERGLACALGEVLTEPKPRVWFDEPEAEWPRHSAVALDRRTRMLYDSEHVFINGEAFRAAGADAEAMHQLANQRHLSAEAVQALSRGAKRLLQDWYESGWVRADQAAKPLS